MNHQCPHWFRRNDGTPGCALLRYESRPTAEECAACILAGRNVAAHEVAVTPTPRHGNIALPIVLERWARCQPCEHHVAALCEAMPGCRGGQLGAYLRGKTAKCPIGRW